MLKNSIRSDAPDRKESSSWSTRINRVYQPAAANQTCADEPQNRFSASYLADAAGMLKIILCAALLVFEMSTVAAGEESAGSNSFSEWVTFNPLELPWDCKGKCAATIYAGPQLTTDLRKVLGSNGFVPAWKYTYGDSAFVGGALSQAFIEFKKFAAVEGEIGLGQRFGNLHDTEIWAALYFRWKWFPWNSFVTTTVAASLGFNYASGVPQYEIDQSGIGRGSNLLNYFSPEITFALPSKPDWQFLIRDHHRSGGGKVWGYTPMFKGVDGGAQYLVFGIRHWY